MKIIRFYLVYSFHDAIFQNFMLGIIFFRIFPNFHVSYLTLGCITLSIKKRIYALFPESSRRKYTLCTAAYIIMADCGEPTAILVVSEVLLVQLL